VPGIVNPLLSPMPVNEMDLAHGVPSGARGYQWVPGGASGCQLASRVAGGCLRLQEVWGSEAEHFVRGP